MACDVTITISEQTYSFTIEDAMHDDDVARILFSHAPGFIFFPTGTMIENRALVLPLDGITRIEITDHIHN